MGGELSYQLLTLMSTARRTRDLKEEIHLLWIQKNMRNLTECGSATKFLRKSRECLIQTCFSTSSGILCRISNNPIQKNILQTSNIKSLVVHPYKTKIETYELLNVTWLINRLERK